MSKNPNLNIPTNPSANPPAGQNTAPAATGQNVSSLTPAASPPQTPLQVVIGLLSQHPQLYLEFAANIATLLAAGFQFLGGGPSNSRTLSLLTPQGRLLASLNLAVGLLEVLGQRDERVLRFVTAIFDSAAQYPQTLWNTFTGLTNGLLAGIKLSKLADQNISNISLQLGTLALAGLIASRAFGELNPKQQAEILLARAQVLGEQARRQLAGPAPIQVKDAVLKEGVAYLSQAIEHLRDASRLDPDNPEIQQLLADLGVLAAQRVPKANAAQLA